MYAPSPVFLSGNDVFEKLVMFMLLPVSNVTLIRLVQYSKAELPILVTLAGMVTLVIPMQLMNALLGMLLPPVIMTVFNDAGIFCVELGVLGADEPNI